MSETLQATASHAVDELRKQYSVAAPPAPQDISTRTAMRLVFKLLEISAKRDAEFCSDVMEVLMGTLADLPALVEDMRAPVLEDLDRFLARIGESQAPESGKR